MARNCEKKLIGLNRLWLAKQQKEELDSRPKRPHLTGNENEENYQLGDMVLIQPQRSLNSASEVKRWIPGIKKEMDYYLDQLSGARQHRYPDTKRKEFEKKVEELENEYKRFVKKVFELDPSTTGVPWQPRGYVSKRKTTDSLQIEVKPTKICTPLLENEDRKFLATQRDDRKECEELTVRGCSSTTHDSDGASKIKNSGSDVEYKRDEVDVHPKNALGLDYESSSDSDVS